MGNEVYSFGKWCLDNNKNEYLRLWDDNLNGCDSFSVSLKSNKRFYFKCPKGLHESQSRILSTVTRYENSNIACLECNSFEQWCIDNNHQDYLDLWDYELNNKKPSEVAKSTHDKYYFKCPKSIHPSEKKILGNIVFQKLTCVGCNSFGQYLLDEYGEEGINDYWSKENNISPFDISFSSTKKVLIKCDRCENHPPYKITCANFVNGNRCPVCCGKTVIVGINSLLDTHPHIVPYLKDKTLAAKYSCGSIKKVGLICSDCGMESTMSIYNLCLRGLACKYCGDGISFPQKVMLNILVEQDIENLESEFSRKWCIDEDGGRRRYDFYFEKNGAKYIIEMDGSFHYKDNQMSGMSLEQCAAIDTMKDEMAREQGIEVIRINSYYDNNDRFEYIKNNIIDGTSHVLDLSNVDWDVVHIKSLSSMMIKAINMWKSNKYQSTTQIANELNLNRHSISNYLNKGKKLGLCEYDGKANSLSALTDGSKFRKKVDVYDMLGNHIKRFESLTELCEMSGKELGVNLSPQYVRSVCYGKKSSHRGYIFEYVNEKE